MLILGALLMAVMVSLGTLWYTARSNQAELENRLQEHAKQINATLEGALDRFVQIGHRLAASPLLALNGDLAPFLAYICAVAETTDTRIVIVAVGPDFHQILNTSLPQDQMAPVGREAAPELRPMLEQVVHSGTPQISNLFIGRADGVQVITAMVPVRRDGQIVAIVSVGSTSIPLQTVFTYLPTISYAEKIWITDGAGHPLYQSALPDDTTPPQVPDWFVAAANRKQNGLTTGPDSNGEPYRIVFVRPANAPAWTVSVWMPLAVLQGQSLESLAIEALAMLFSVAAVGLTGAVVWKHHARAQGTLARLHQERQHRRRLNEGLPLVFFQVRVEPDWTAKYHYLGGDIALVTGWPSKALRRTEDWEARMVGGPIPRRTLYAAAFTDGASQQEFDMHRADDSTARLLIRYHRLAQYPEGNGELVGYLRDVTQEHRAAAQVVHAARLASLGEMAAALAHELRQPLAIMSFTAENATDDLAAQDYPAARQRLERITEQCIRAGTIVDHLQAFSRGDAPDAPVVSVNLQEALSYTLTLVGSALRHAGVEIRVELGDAAILVQAQQISLEQVLMNLLMNALDALSAQSPENDRWIRLSRLPDQGGAMVRIEIADSGGGYRTTCCREFSNLS